VRGKDRYTIDQSFIASNVTHSGEVSCPSDISYLSINGAEFCTAYISYSPPVAIVTNVVTPPTSVLTSTTTAYTTTTTYGTEVQVVSSTTTVTANRKRAVQTPASISSWSPSRISKACSAVASGKTTTTMFQTAETPLSTFVTTQVSTAVSMRSTTTVTTLISIATVQPAPLVNLLTNPGFESDGNGWSGSRVEANSANAHTGEKYT
jgi:hypothetical protein